MGEAAGGWRHEEQDTASEAAIFSLLSEHTLETRLADGALELSAFEKLRRQIALSGRLLVTRAEHGDSTDIARSVEGGRSRDTAPRDPSCTPMAAALADRDDVRVEEEHVLCDRLFSWRKP